MTLKRVNYGDESGNIEMKLNRIVVGANLILIVAVLSWEAQQVIIWFTICRGFWFCILMEILEDFWFILQWNSRKFFMQKILI